MKRILIHSLSLAVTSLALFIIFYTLSEYESDVFKLYRGITSFIFGFFWVWELLALVDSIDDYREEKDSD